MVKFHVVHDAQKKVLVIAELLAERGLLPDAHMTSVLRECKKAIPPSTFKSAIYTGRLAGPMCAELSRLCNSIDQSEVDLLLEPTFIDLSISALVRDGTAQRDYPGADTAPAFEKQLRARFGLNQGVLAKAVTTNPDLFDANLFSFELDDAGQETAIGEPMQLFFAAVLDVLRDVSGIELGFNRIRIQLRLDDTSDLRIESRATDTRIRDARLTVEGRSKAARWTLRAKEGAVLRGEYATTDAAMCALQNVRLNTAFSATASVNLLEPGVVVLTTPAPVENATREIIKRLMERSIDVGNESGGWKTLGIQNVVVVKS